jgi:hypothetical protein
MANEDPQDDRLVFHYSRDERLRHAPDAVRRLNDPGLRKRPSLLQTLVPNRASAFLLLGILMLSATLLVTKLLVPPENTVDIAGNRFTLNAFRYQGGTYLSLKKRPVKDGAYRGPIDILVSGEDDPKASTGRQLVLHEGEEDFRLSIDGEHQRVQVILTVGASRVTLRSDSK